MTPYLIVVLYQPRDQRPGFNPWVGKVPWRSECYPLQYSGLENSMDCIVHGVTKNQTRLSNFHFHFASNSEIVGMIAYVCQLQ